MNMSSRSFVNSLASSSLTFILSILYASTCSTPISRARCERTRSSISSFAETHGLRTNNDCQRRYAIVCLEVFILGWSTYALTYGERNPPWRWEAALHLGCALGGVTAFVVFFVMTIDIENQGYARQVFLCKDTGCHVWYLLFFSRNRTYGCLTHSP